jgi:hypothetical protein
MERLEWSGKKGFNAEELEEWKVDGKVAGSYKSYKNLSVSCKIFSSYARYCRAGGVLTTQLLKVLYAGHMCVPSLSLH